MKNYLSQDEVISLAKIVDNWINDEAGISIYPGHGMPGTKLRVGYTGTINDITVFLRYIEEYVYVRAEHKHHPHQDLSGWYRSKRTPELIQLYNKVASIAAQSKRRAKNELITHARKIIGGGE